MEQKLKLIARWSTMGRIHMATGLQMPVLKTREYDPTHNNVFLEALANKFDTAFYTPETIIIK